ncbi:MAG: metallopeptidase family protein [Aeriscardovia sp.]|nr:metallopeptidase family protein [Aeriscardovia sp.]MBR6434743.1 metallopeptidase family protein [Aeriscardovia sp.]
MTYRNMHGRGQRRPVFGAWLPRYRTSAGIFDSIVLSQLRRLRNGWPDLVDAVQCAVEDVPPVNQPPWVPDQIRYSHFFPAKRDEAPRIVLYRRPLESMSRDHNDLQLLIREELVLCLSEMSGLHPEDIDPDYDA